MYPYRKKPAHLTDEEDQMIRTIGEGFQDLNKSWDRNELGIRAVRGEMKKEAEQMRLRESMLMKCEKLPICIRDSKKRQAMEKKCKKMRTLFIQAKEEQQNSEQRIVALEARVARADQDTQAAFINSARTLVLLSKRVRIRREAQAQAKAPGRRRHRDG